uniref:Disease resistance R13L4/SHOC-2-like LRR domain-containing protein n=1 Tax=Bionectria ochroleuca TaxID=29856 RepID=A0A8H7TNQ3_BIOOC
MAVERLDRSNGAPAAPVLRSLSENPLSGRRPIPNSAATSNGPQHPPIPTMRKSASSSNLAVGNGMNSSHVLSLAREAMRTALESENQVAEASAVSASLQPGVTIDLSRKNIHKLPEEVVDIMKNDLARLILAHNQLTALPARFSECTSLRYLNLRANQLSEFPMTLCDLKALEVLELGRNQIQYLPPEIAKLTSLKMLSLRKNRIRELPLSIGDMTSLQALKFEGNPLVFPPKDALLLQAPSPVGDGTIRDNDVELAVTAQMKRWLKQYSLTGRLENDQAGDESSEGTETPRAPLKRRVSGRFPIKVNGADPSDSRSPSTSRIPPSLNGLITAGCPSKTRPYDDLV